MTLLVILKISYPVPRYLFTSSAIEIGLKQLSFTLLELKEIYFSALSSSSRKDRGYFNTKALGEESRKHRGLWVNCLYFLVL